MKSRIRILAAGTVLFLSVLFAQKSIAQQYVSLQVFYDQLSPYGQWLDNPDYGYVWLPDAGPDFVPYGSRGHWIFTEYGWTWMSGYEWGWAPFHYGRWDFDNYYGWFWIPDNEWGPAWVSWRRAEGYYGWEPLGPGISITISFGRQYDRGHDHWIFVRDRDFNRQDVNRYYVDRSQNSTIVVNSTIINNTYIDNSRNTTYVTGPDRSAIQKESGRRVNSVAISEYSQPGQKMENGSLHIYRPQVTQNSDRDQKPAPSRYMHIKDVKPEAGARQENNVNPPKGNNFKQRYGNQPERGMTPQNQSVNESKTEKGNQPVRVAPENRTQNETRPSETNNERKNQPVRVAPENRPPNETRPAENNAERKNQSGSVAPENHPPQETKPSENNSEKRNQSSEVAPENHPANEAKPAEQNRQNENTQNKSVSPQKSDQHGSSTKENKEKNTKSSGKSNESEKSKSKEK